MQRHAEVVIAGGGLIGSAIAFFVARDPDFAGRVCVIERDPTYRRASSSLSVGGTRQQFSNEENVLIGRFAAEFFRACREERWLGPAAPDPGFVEAGYLFLATDGGRATLSENVELQRGLGVEVDLLCTADLAARFPWLDTGGLAAGAVGLRGEGWIDPHALHTGFRLAAVEAGVEFLHAEVTGVEVAGGRVDAVRLHSGDRIGAGVLVNATGPAAARFSALAGGTPLPVHPRRRMVFVFECEHGPHDAPLVIEPGGVYFRPEGGRFLCGQSPPPELDPDTEDLTVDRSWFEDRVWPALASRVPAFDRLRLTGSWAGLYAVNEHDHNAIVGFDPALPNFLLANGFSGHGVQQSPAIGRAAAELIVHGGFRTLDLGRMSPARLLSGERLLERNVI